jgi:hypothetical protein
LNEKEIDFRRRVSFLIPGNAISVLFRYMLVACTQAACTQAACTQAACTQARIMRSEIVEKLSCSIDETNI